MSENEEEKPPPSPVPSRNLRANLKRLSTSAITPVASRDYRKIFELFDADQNGFIDKKELTVMVAKLQGKKPKEEEVEKLLQEFDLNQDGMIGFDEFCIMMSFGSTIDKKEEEEEAERVFKRLDKDNKNHLTKKDLSKMFTQCGLRLSQSEVDEAFFLLDEDQDGVLSLKEFTKGYIDFSVKS